MDNLLLIILIKQKLENIKMNKKQGFFSIACFMLLICNIGLNLITNSIMDVL